MYLWNQYNQLHSTEMVRKDYNNHRDAHLFVTMVRSRSYLHIRPFTAAQYRLSIVRLVHHKVLAVDPDTVQVVRVDRTDLVELADGNHHNCPTSSLSAWYKCIHQGYHLEMDKLTVHTFVVAVVRNMSLVVGIDLVDFHSQLVHILKCRKQAHHRNPTPASC